MYNSRTRRRATHFIALAVALALGLPALAAATDPILRGRIYRHATNAHDVYVGESTNYVDVLGDGSTDLDCWIYNADVELVDSDTDSTDHCILRTPGLGMHRLVIHNYGDVYNDYVVTRR